MGRVVRVTLSILPPVSVRTFEIPMAPTTGSAARPTL